MSHSGVVSRMNRVRQWAQFARQWHLMDANQQDVFKLGEKVALHLAGRHKPLHHSETDCGDHVVVVNCRDIAMHGFDWKHTLFHFDKGYPRSKADIPAWQLHEYDPCRVVFLSIYKALGNNLPRRRHIQRLHLFPDGEMPDFVQKNIGNVMSPVQSLVRRSDEYTAQEREAFPRLVQHRADHLIDWERPFSNPGRHPRQGERPPPTKAEAAKILGGGAAKGGAKGGRK